MRLRFRSLPPLPAPAEAGPGELLVRPRTPPAASPGLTLLALRDGPAAFVQGSGPIASIVVPADPTLDDLLATLVLQGRLAGDAFPADVPLAHYAAALAQGLHPARGVPADELIEGVFAHYRQAAGDPLTDPDRAARFLADWSRLATLLRPALADPGVDPFGHSLLAGRSDFRAECQYLGRDRAVYERDVRRGRRWRVRLPGMPDDGPALRLDDPRSVLFKFWARTDPAARPNVPGRPGYHFLAVRWGDRDWFFSTDPLDRYDLRSLAGALQAAERARDPDADADPWYDGRRHGHSIVRPPHRGTRLTADEVWQVVAAWGQARPVVDPVRPNPAGRRLRAAAVILALGLAVGLGVQALTHRQAVTPTAVPPRASSDPFVQSGVVGQWRAASGLQDQVDGRRSAAFRPAAGQPARREFRIARTVDADRPLLVWLAATGREPPAGTSVGFDRRPPEPVPGWHRLADGTWRTPPFHLDPDGADARVVVAVPPGDPPDAVYDLDLAWRANPHAVHLHVLTIGVGTYGPPSGVADLPYAAADARDLADAFGRLRGPLFTRVRVMPPLVDAEATANGIRRRLHAFREQVLADAAPLKLAVIALSGHGAIYDGRAFFFLPSDYDPADLTTPVYWGDIETHLGDLGCHTVLLLDSCHSGQAAFQSATLRAVLGGTPRGVPTADGLAEAIEQFGQERPGWFVLAAADGKGRAWENEKHGHGAMTQAVLEVLRGEAPPVAGGVYTLDDLHAHARKRVREMAREAGVAQSVVPAFAPGRRPDVIPIAYLPQPPRPR